MDIWHYGFFVRAMIAGVLCGALCPVVGVFLVARRFSFFADALAHVSLTGLALGLVLGIAPGITTVAAVVSAAFAVEWLRQRHRFYADALLAAVMAGGLALGVILVSKSRGFGADLTGYLFGSLLTIGPTDLWFTGVLFVIAVVVVIPLYKGLLAIALDEEYARAAGLPVVAINAVFITVAALTVAVAIRAVGVLLAGALIVIPVLVAVRVTRSFRGALFAAVVTGVALVVGGLHLSYALDLPSGPAVVLLGIVTLVGVSFYQQLVLRYR
ncbi:MAG: metal ABC transporter permease [Ammonifex sp.]|jgi:zinc transport system permease protein|nr:MAG: metal ABC transporter permease [Ammonifex sp.]